MDEPVIPSGARVELSYIRAINTALHWALSEYPKVIVFGEDVAVPNGPFGATKGLKVEYGERVFDTPISEGAMLGTALGAAVLGMRPVVEVMYGDFLLVAMDQIINQIANARYVSRGGLVPRLTIRTQQGATPGSCAQHSQSLEALFAHIPGLRVGLPSTSGDAYDMLRSAIASDDPVLIMESRRLYSRKGPVQLQAPVRDPGGCCICRSGRDLTIVTWSTMVAPSLEAAQVLAAEGVEAEVLDVRWLSPLDLDTVVDSVARTRRLTVIHEANRTGGFGAEIVASVMEQLGPQIQQSPLRIAAPDIRVPASPVLSAAVLPNATSIVARIRAWLK